MLGVKAPSWSWASREFGHGSLLHRSSLYNNQGLFYDVTVINARTKAKGNDPFGAVVSGVLHIKGQLKVTSLQVRVLPRKRGYRNLDVCSSSAEGINSVARWYPDTDLWQNKQTLEAVVLLIAKRSAGGSQIGWFALALEEVRISPDTSTKRRTFKRVGVMEANNSGNKDHQLAWFKECEYEEIDII